MADYLLIESRGEPAGRSAADAYQLAADLASAGHQVTLFLVENGVLPARSGAQAERLASLPGAGVDVRADRFSLAERGIGEARLLEGIRPAPLDDVIDLLAAGRKALWH